MMMNFRVKQQSRPQTTAGTRNIETNSYASKSIKQGTTPKVWKDKENLYDENIQLKLILNETKIELQKSKLKNVYLEKELQRYENLLNEQVKGQVDYSAKLPLERQGLVMKLKNKQKSLIMELSLRNKELYEIKRGIKHNQVLEMEIELQNYIDETIRLRQQLEHIGQLVDLQSAGDSIEEKCLQQDKTLKILQKDNIDLNQNLVQSDLIAKQHKTKIEELQKFIGQLQQDANNYIYQIGELKQHIRQVNEEQVSTKKTTQTDLIEQIRQDYILQMNSLQLKMQEEIDQKVKEIRELNLEVYKQGLHIQELEKLIEQTEQQYATDNQLSAGFQKDSVVEFTPEPKKQKQLQLEMKPTTVKKRLPKVQYHEVKEQAIRIKLALIANKISYDSIDEYFNESEEISIYKMKEILQQHPFNMTMQPMLTILCRYLIEDNSEDFIIYDENRSNSTAIVKSVLKKIIGKYTLLNQSEEQELMEDIKKKFNPSLLDTVQMIIAKKKHLAPGLCELSDFDQAMKFHEIHFNSKEQDKFDMLVFEQSQSLDYVAYQKVISYLK